MLDPGRDSVAVRQRRESGTVSLRHFDQETCAVEHLGRSAMRAREHRQTGMVGFDDDPRRGIEAERGKQEQTRRRECSTQIRLLRQKHDVRQLGPVDVQLTGRRLFRPSAFHYQKTHFGQLGQAPPGDFDEKRCAFPWFRVDEQNGLTPFGRQRERSGETADRLRRQAQTLSIELGQSPGRSEDCVGILEGFAVAGVGEIEGGGDTLSSRLAHDRLLQQPPAINVEHVGSAVAQLFAHYVEIPLFVAAGDVGTPRVAHRYDQVLHPAAIRSQQQRLPSLAGAMDSPFCEVSANRLVNGGYRSGQSAAPPAQPG
jgi:hypothetical protein